MKLVHLALLAAAAVVTPAAAAAEAKKPNIVFILADDLGYADLKCYGHPYARTPNLDKLASEGTRFTQFYMTGVTCCPSRTGLMTGKFPATFREYPAGCGFGKRITVTELLKKQGYTTGHFGKWHIGPTQNAGDLRHRFDQRHRQRRAIGRKRQDDRGRDAHIYDDAIKFIEKQQERPVLRQRVGAHQPLPGQPAAGSGG